MNDEDSTDSQICERRTCKMEHFHLAGGLSFKRLTSHISSRRVCEVSSMKNEVQPSTKTALNYGSSSIYAVSVFLFYYHIS